MFGLPPETSVGGAGGSVKAGVGQASAVHRFIGILLPQLNTTAMGGLQSDSGIRPIQRLPHITHCKTK